MSITYSTGSPWFLGHARIERHGPYRFDRPVLLTCDEDDQGEASVDRLRPLAAAVRQASAGHRQRPTPCSASLDNDGQRPFGIATIDTGGAIRVRPMLTLITDVATRTVIGWEVDFGHRPHVPSYVCRAMLPRPSFAPEAWVHAASAGFGQAGVA